MVAALRSVAPKAGAQRSHNTKGVGMLEKLGRRCRIRGGVDTLHLVLEGKHYPRYSVPRCYSLHRRNENGQGVIALDRSRPKHRLARG